MTKVIANQENIMNDIKLLEHAFKDIILSRLGIIIKDYQSKDLHRTILEVCEKLQCTPEKYLKLLQTTSDSEKIYEHLIENITIGETYFFRDKHQMALLEKIILPALIEKKRRDNNLSLRIWSAGCSSGEEIYTIAILLAQLLPDLTRWSLQLLGTDINTKVLKKALNAEYTTWSMRSIADDIKKHFFIIENNNYKLIPAIKKMAKFTYLNLSDDAFPMMFSETNAQDLILCRNVLIYFNAEKTQLLMHRLSSSLTTHGFLLLGASDPIQTSGTKLVPYYQNGTLLSHLYINKMKEIRTSETFNISQPTAEVIKPLPFHTSSKIVNIQPKIQNLLTQEKWAELLSIPDEATVQPSEKSLLLSAKATSAANLGRLDDAVSLCQKNLSLDPTNLQAYFTLAMSLIELNKVQEAKSALRKALFLDHQFVIGHYQLGLLLLRNNEFQSGIRSLKNAVALAKTHPSNETVTGFASVTYGYLSEIFSKELEIYQAGEGTNHGTKQASIN